MTSENIKRGLGANKRVALIGTIKSVDYSASRCTFASDDGRVFIERLDCLTDAIEPEHIPDFIAKWIAERKELGFNSIAITEWLFQAGMEACVKEWALDNPESFIRALANGCVVKSKPDKKFNVIAYKDPRGKCETRYWQRFKNDVITATDKENDRDNQQWTLTQVKDYGLEKFGRVEVQTNETQS